MRKIGNVLSPWEALALKAGGRKERSLPDGWYKGRFKFYGSIPDNATTAQDLTTSVHDPNILSVGGYSAAQTDPAVILRVERIGFSLTEGVEALDDLYNILRYARLTHTPAGGGGVSRVIQLSEYMSRVISNISRAATDGVAYLAATREQNVTFFVPFSPLVVDLERDTFTIHTSTAVDTAAAVPFVLDIDGLAHSNAGFVRQRAACDDDFDPVTESEDSFKSDAEFSIAPNRPRRIRLPAMR